MTEFYNLLWEAVLLTSQCGTVGHRKQSVLQCFEKSECIGEIIFCHNAYLQGEVSRGNEGGVPEITYKKQIDWLFQNPLSLGAWFQWLIVLES